jgi:hypothetical protein
MRWVVNATPWQLYPRERRGTHCIGGWVDPRACLDGIRSPDRPASNESLFRLSYLGPYVMVYNLYWLGWKCTSKGKAIPFQALPGPEGSRRVRLSDFKTIGTLRWQGCQPYAPAAFTPRKYSWYSFLLEAESTPWP